MPPLKQPGAVKAADWSAVCPAAEKPGPAAAKKIVRPSKPTPIVPTFGSVDDIEKLKGLSLRQPWAEQIIRGEKTVEYRQIPTKHRGRIYIYASLGRNSSEEEAVDEEEVGYGIDDLPRGVVIGTVEVVGCIAEGNGEFAWQLVNPQRLALPVTPIEQAQPIWFHPFGRR